MSTEEILDDFFKKGFFEDFEKVIVCEMMQKYADQEKKTEAIAFAEWAEKNFSYSFGTYEALDPNDNRKVVVPHVEYTTEQLYELFRTNNQKQ